MLEKSFQNTLLKTFPSHIKKVFISQVQNQRSKVEAKVSQQRIVTEYQIRDLTDQKRIIGNLTEKVRISVPYFRSKHESGMDDTKWTRTSLSSHLEGQTRITNPSILTFRFIKLLLQSFRFHNLHFKPYNINNCKLSH